MKHEDILDYLFNKVKSLGAEKIDGAIINSTSISNNVRHGKIDNIESSESFALGIRVIINNRQAITSTNDFSKESLDNTAKSAVDIAKQAPENKFIDISKNLELGSDIDLYDNFEPDNKWLFKKAIEAETAALENKQITNSEGADASYARNQVIIANSNGFLGSYKSSSYSVAVSVLAGTENMERDYEYCVKRFAKDLTPSDKIGVMAAERAVRRLNPRQIKTGEFPVVFDKRISSSLIGNIASALNGSNIISGSSFLKNQLNKKIFSNNFNLINDPLIKKGLGSRPFDSEGNLSFKFPLIEDGYARNYLLDIATSNELGMQNTNSASRGLASSPYPSASNLYLQNGLISFEDLIKDIKYGVYINETSGMGFNIVTGDYSQGAAGFLIENGEITYPISEITIASNFNKMFNDIEIANDIEFKYQNNSPSFKINKMTIAGS